MSLRSHVMRLRTDLARGGGEAVVETQGDGYRLCVGSSDVDAGRFEKLIVEAGRCADPRSAIQSYDMALALWRDEAYLEFGDAAFAVTERIRLAELRASALERRTDLGLSLGMSGELVAGLEQRVLAAPYRERGWEQLALALYRDGRQADALGACRRARAVLVEDLGVDPGAGLRALEQRLLRQDPDLRGHVLEAVSATPVLEGCPYLGLAGYEEADAALFVGRERLTSVLAGRLADQSVVVVTGPSGVGKSSLVRAGLVPALRSGALPGSAAWRVDVRTLAGGLPDYGARRPDLLILDQAEELFTDPDMQRREGMLAWLGDYVERDEGRLVLVLRGDFFGRLADVETLAPFAQKATLLVGSMRADELRRALVEPAAAAGTRLEDELIETIMDDVAGQPEPLPLLSAVMLRTWRLRRGNVLTLEAYRRAGELSGALEAAAEECFTPMTDRQRRAARHLLVRMATRTASGWVRRPVGCPDRTDESEHEALAALVAARLVVVGEDRVEITHDALLTHWPRLRDWLDERDLAADLLQHLDQAAAAWRAAGRQGADLYRGPRLSAAIDWRAEHPEDLSVAELEFLDASARAADAELLAERRGRRNLRRVAVALGALVVVAVAGAAIALNERGTANSQARRARQAALTADARRLAALSIDAPDIATSSLLAAAAYRLQDSADSRGALLDAVERDQSALWRIQFSQRPQHLVGSEDGSWLAVNDNRAEPTITVVDALRRRQVATFTAADNQAQVIGISRGSEQVITFGPTNGAVPTGRLAVYAVPTGHERVVSDRGDLNAPLPVATPDGRWVAFVTTAHTGSKQVVDVFDSSDWAAPPRTFVTTTGPIGIAAARSALAVESWNGSVEVYSLPALRLIGRLPAASRSRTVPISLFAENTGRIAVSPDGDMVARVDPNVGTRVALYRAGARTPTGTPLPAQPALVNTLAFSPDGAQVAVGSVAGSLGVYASSGGRQIAALHGHINQVNGIAWSGATTATGLYTAGQDGQLVSWDLGAGPRTVSESGPERTPPIRAALFGPRVIGDVQPGDANSSRQLFTVDVGTGAYTRWPAGLHDDEGIWQIVASPDGGRALVSIGGGAAGDRVAIVDLHSHRTIGQLAFPPGSDLSSKDGLSAAISPDARFAFCALDRNRIGVFAVPSGRYLRTFSPGFANPDAGRLQLIPQQVDPAGRLVVAALDPGPGAADRSRDNPPQPADDRLGLVDVLTGKLVAQTRLGDIGAPTALAWTHTGRSVAVGTADGTLALYGADSLALQARAGLVAAGPVDSLDFSRDDRALVLGAGDVSFWSVPELTREGQAIEIGGSEGSGGLSAWYAPDGDVVGFASDADRPDAGVRWFSLRAQPSSLLSIACQLAGSDITEAQWQRYVGDRPYRHVCS